MNNKTRIIQQQKKITNKIYVINLRTKHFLSNCFQIDKKNETGNVIDMIVVVKIWQAANKHRVREKPFEFI